MASKGKGIAKDSSSGKRKLRDDNNSSAARKRRDRSVLQFFEDVAPEVGGESDDSDFFDDLMDMEEDLETLPAFKNDDAKAQNIPFFPKEEEMNEEEFDRMMEEVYNRAPGLGAFAEENYENKNSTGRNPPTQSARDTSSLWKVKCMVGRERQSIFCLMQKFVDLHSFGTKLQIKSAFCVEHVKGFIYIEAPRQYDLIEACKGISGIYSTRVASVPENDISQLLTVRSRVSEVTVGTMARVKNGKYKGDLAQIVAVNNARKRATVKLVPRIDLQAMAEKFGGGAAAKKTANPAPRLINSSELDEFRPLMQFRRDRETGKLFEFLDGMMLKDGYLYKKISLDSLNCWGVMPSEDELLKFKPPESSEAIDLEWLSQLYGEKKKKKVIRTEKGGGKGEGSSGSSSMSSFGDHDLVCFGRKDFGMILGMEKDDSYKILKEGPDGSVVVNVQRKELKSGPLDAKFTAADHNGKIISVSDNVKVLEGSLKDKQGIVKHVYRNTVFVYDENEVDNDGYFCCKSNMCEKIKVSYDAPGGKEDDKGFSGFDDFSSSPKSPLSPKKPWAEETGRDYNRDDRADGMFSIGQTLRIRVGPLKGYLCRVIAVRKRDVTVKLDSQQKVLTVRSDFLSEVQRKSSAASLSEDPLKPFDILGNEGSSQDWIGGMGSSAGGDGWNSAGPSTERSPWPSFPESGTSNCPGSSSTNPFGSESLDAKKDEDSPWVSKSTPDASTSWGAAKSSVDTANGGQASGWGRSNSKTCSDGNASGAWGTTAVPSGDSTGFTDSESGGWKKGNTPAETSADRWGSKNRSSGSWGDQNTSTTVSEIQPAGEGNAGGCTKPEAENKVNASGWNEGTSIKGSQTSNWGAQDETGAWGKPKNEFPSPLVCFSKPFRRQNRHRCHRHRRFHLIMRSTTAAVNESAAAETGGGSPGEIMLFGVRVVVDSMRKSVSLNNLSQYEQPHDAADVIANNNKNDLVSVNNKDDVAAGYASADDAVPNARGNRERERKRGVPWTEEEHKLFLIGLQQVGKGDWRGISRNFVKTRTPTQVASHAQKYFLRRSNLNRRRRRSSLFDITTDTVTAAPMVEEPVQRQEIPSQSHSFTPSTLPEISKNNVIPIIQTLPLSFGPTPLATPTKNLMEKCGPREVNTENDGSLKLGLADSIFSSNQIPTSTGLNTNSTSAMESLSSSSSSSALSLRLSLTSDQRDASSRHSTFQSIPSFNSGDAIISAA